MRWPNGPIGPHCGEDDNAYLLKATRKTSTGKVSDRRVWKCAECRKQFSVLVGTIFESSHVPLSKWLLAFYMLTASKNGVAAWEIHRTLAVTRKTAWFMINVSSAMIVPLIVSATDESFIASRMRCIGGSVSNMHAWKRNQIHPRIPGRRSGLDKTPYCRLSTMKRARFALP